MNLVKRLSHIWGNMWDRDRCAPWRPRCRLVSISPLPGSRRQLRRCGYYHGFCKNFASVVAPLTALTSPSKSFVWTDMCQDSFDAAKALHCNAPVLAAPDFTRPFKVEVDASAHGAGAVIVQEALALCRSPQSRWFCPTVLCRC